MNKSAAGQEMYRLIKKLYPICRSLTGEGVRKTLKVIKEYIPLKIHRVATGTKAFDWTVPKEWNIKAAYIKNSKGKKVVNFKLSNLHVLNYSIPVRKKMGLRQLKQHLFTLPTYPRWIPYLTSYYKENWGFCLAHNQFKKLKEEKYEVVIDSILEKGYLNYGELYIKGQWLKEVLFSCYVCHPSLCNDNLSGVALLTFLAQALLKTQTQYSYRFLFIPETIGSLVWLSRNQNRVKYIKHGLVATCVGDRGQMTYKKSRRGNADIDKVVEQVLKDSGDNYRVVDFWPSGSDERQFCSPGFNLPVGSLMRTPYDMYPQYHTSADNLDFVTPNCLADSLSKYREVVYVLEHNRYYQNLNPKGEPMLGKRGLYQSIGGQKQSGKSKLALLWLLNLADGDNSLLDIAIRSGLTFRTVKAGADDLVKVKLLRSLRKSA